MTLEREVKNDYYGKYILNEDTRFYVDCCLLCKSKMKDTSIGDDYYRVEIFCQLYQTFCISLFCLKCELNRMDEVQTLVEEIRGND